MNLRFTSDEFFFTLGVVPPPDQTEITAVLTAGQAVAQPVFRFAVSRDTMEQFLTLMAGLFDQQIRLNYQSPHLSQGTNNDEEVDEHE